MANETDKATEYGDGSASGSDGEHEPQATSEEVGRTDDQVAVLKAAGEALGFIGKVQALCSRVLDGLGTGDSDNGNGGGHPFLNIISVWLGFSFIVFTVLSARFPQLTTLPVYQELNEWWPYGKWAIAIGLIGASGLVSGLVANGYKATPYGKLIIVGVRWGLVAIFLIAMSPLFFIVSDLVLGWMM